MTSTANLIAQSSTMQALTAEMGSDATRVGKLLDKGGAPLVALLDAFVKPEQVRNMGQKARLHTLHIANFIISQGLDFQGYSKAHAFIASLCALAPLGVRISYADAHHLLGAQGDQFTRPVPGVSRARLQRFIGAAGALGTVTTRTSSTVGVNGLFACLGVTAKGDKHGFEIVSRDAPLLIAYAQQLEKMTDGALQLLNDK